MLDLLFRWIKTLDLKEFIYALTAVAVSAIFAAWLGAFRNTTRWLVRRRGISSYEKALRKNCESLTVVGRPEGFSLPQMWVPLDLAPSDLNTQKPDSSKDLADRSQVIVAGPGAGKSTLVKKRILDHLDSNTSLPFLLRLREYAPDRSIHQYLSDQLRAYNIPGP